MARPGIEPRTGKGMAAYTASKAAGRTFLRNHVGCLVFVDFFTVPTATFAILFVFMVLRHDRRRIVHFSVTAQPTASWVAQQIREAFPWDTGPRHLIRDRDGIYGATFRTTVAAMGIEEIVTAPRSCAF